MEYADIKYCCYYKVLRVVFFIVDVCTCTYHWKLLIVSGWRRMIRCTFHSYHLHLSLCLYRYHFS